MKSKCLIIFALTILILSIGAVSASDLNQTDTIQANENTFQDIQDTINNASDNDVIYLEGTYTGNGDKITLDKPLTITSKNKATLNANGLSQIFDVNANNVIFKNINFINGKSEYGGAIQFKGCNYTIDNCIFTNNNADYGGAVTLEGSNVEVLNSIFVNNKAKSSYNFASGGAIHGLLKNSLISGCTFKSNYAS